MAAAFCQGLADFGCWIRKNVQRAEKVDRYLESWGVAAFYVHWRLGCSSIGPKSSKADPLSGQGVTLMATALQILLRY